MHMLNVHILYSDLHMLSLGPGSVLCKQLPCLLQSQYQDQDIGSESVTQLPSLHAVMLSFAAFKALQEGGEHTATLEISSVFHNIVAFYLVRLLWQRHKYLGLTGACTVWKSHMTCRSNIEQAEAQQQVTMVEEERRITWYSYGAGGSEGRNHVSLQVCCLD